MRKIAPAIAALVALAFGCAPAQGDWTPAVPKGFRIERIAGVPGARELAFAPDGNLFVGTRGGDVYIIPHAGGNSESPRVFAHFDDDPASGVSFDGGYLYVGTEHAVWRVPYRSGELHANSAPEKLAAVRTGSPPAGSDGDVHTTTSVAVARGHIYASVGSSCNECVETDPTRATVGEVKNGRYVVIAKRIRNAIALAIDPATGSLWASDAGQDELPPGHPYEFLDDVTSHGTSADYGWPFCYEDHKHKPGTNENCDRVALPRVIFPAYETPIGAVFYPQHQRGRFAFPSKYQGGVFVTFHGSWHGPQQGISGFMPPRVVFVPLHGDTPAHAINWNDPSSQWSDFASGYQQGGSPDRAGRPSGITVGPQGALFLGDDQTGSIYRIRPE
jgi:glucose/arabinose dehydrogenase